jgi:hypothetical protein
MKAYGYSSKVDIGKGPLPLDEISFWGQPDTLRELAKFINLMANEIRCNPGFDHMHLRDAWDKWTEDYPDVIICKQE